MSEVKPQITTGHDRDLANWMTVWMRSSDASSADVMRLVSAFNESWLHILTGTKDTEEKLRQALFSARSPSEAAAAYGTWCLAVAQAAMQENQRLLQTGMSILTERTQRTFSSVNHLTPPAGEEGGPAGPSTKKVEKT